MSIDMTVITCCCIAMTGIKKRKGMKIISCQGRVIKHLIKGFPEA